MGQASWWKISWNDKSLFTSLHLDLNCILFVASCSSIYVAGSLNHILTKWGHSEQNGWDFTDFERFHGSLFPRVHSNWQRSQHWFRWWLCAEQGTSHYLKSCWLSAVSHICIIVLIHCGLVTPYEGIDLGQFWLRPWIVAIWRHQVITWTN